MLRCNHEKSRFLKEKKKKRESFDGMNLSDNSLQSWKIVTRSNLKENEPEEFGLLFTSLPLVSLSAKEDAEGWILGSSGKFSVDSLSEHLSSSSPLNKALFLAIWILLHSTFSVFVMCLQFSLGLLVLFIFFSFQDL